MRNINNNDLITMKKTVNKIDMLIDYIKELFVEDDNVEFIGNLTKDLKKKEIKDKEEYNFTVVVKGKDDIPIFYNCFTYNYDLVKNLKKGDFVNVIGSEKRYVNKSLSYKKVKVYKINLIKAKEV